MGQLIATVPPVMRAPGDAIVPVAGHLLRFEDARTGQRHHGVVAFDMGSRPDAAGIAEITVILDEIKMPDNTVAITEDDCRTAVAAWLDGGGQPGTVPCIRSAYAIVGFELGDQRPAFGDPCPPGYEATLERAVAGLPIEEQRANLAAPPHALERTATQWAEHYGIRIIGLWPSPDDEPLTLRRFADLGRTALLTTSDISRGGVPAVYRDAGLE
jgi:hypothetical protein